MALRSIGRVTAWGDNSSGLTKVLAIAAGGAHSLALVGTRAPWTKFDHISCTTNGLVHFTVAGFCGDVCRVLGSTNLLNWQTLATLGNATGAVEFVDDLATNYSQRFYRIRMP
jgi:hypothetical protein